MIIKLKNNKKYVAFSIEDVYNIISEELGQEILDIIKAENSEIQNEISNWKTDLDDVVVEYVREIAQLEERIDELNEELKKQRKD